MLRCDQIQVLLFANFKYEKYKQKQMIMSKTV